MYSKVELAITDVRFSQSMNTLTSLLPSCIPKDAVTSLIDSGMGTAEGIYEEQNGRQQNESLNFRA
jgi:hypothetical protein